MTNETIAAFITALEADSALRVLLGGAGRVRFGSLPEHEQIPGAYVTGGTTNMAEPAFGYLATPPGTDRFEECDDTVQIDVFAMTPELAGDVAKRLNQVIFAGIAGLSGLHKVGGMDPNTDPRPGLWHATARYAFAYTQTD